MTLTDILLPTYSQMLRALSSWLEKAASQLDTADALLSARLSGDMFPLSTQIRFACVQAYEGVHRLRGEPLSDDWSSLLEEGRNGGEAPGTIKTAQERIRQTLSFLEGVGDHDLDSTAPTMAIDLPMGMIFDMTPEQYVRDWALPQFYFHLNTAYAILRQQGLELGKADYVQHAFPYLRPGTMPTG